MFFEANSLIGNYHFLQCIGTSNSCNSENLGTSDEHDSSKRRKLCVVEVDVECVNGVESKSATFISSESGSSYVDVMSFKLVLLS